MRSLVAFFLGGATVLLIQNGILRIPQPPPVQVRETMPSPLDQLPRLPQGWEWELPPPLADKKAL